jgi:hypothetical protein
MSTILYSDYSGGIDHSRPANLQDANRLRVLQNAYVTPGKSIRKRPGARYCWSWGPGVKGLYPGPGYLTGFWGDGNADRQAVTQGAFLQDTGIFVSSRLQAGGGDTAPGNEVIDVRTAFLVAGQAYVVANTDMGMRHYFVAPGDNQIVDSACPHGAAAVPLASKVFGTAPQGVVSFSKTDDPSDWSEADDAGFLPTNRKTRGSMNLTAMGEFDGLLVAFFEDGAQIWEVDPDPEAMRYVKTIAVGAVAGDSAANVGADLFFASPVGVRSIVLHSQSGNAMDLDVGAPVDRLAQALIAEPGALMARFMPSLGQFWLIKGARALVYSFSRTAKVFAWSEYEFPWGIAGAADFEHAVYLRSAAGDIYRLDADYPFDDDAAAAVSALGVARDPLAWAGVFPPQGLTIPRVVVQTAFFDMKATASLKQIHAMDVVATRTPRGATPEGLPRLFQVTHLFRPATGDELFEAGPIGLSDAPDDTRQGGTVPVGLMAPAIAARIEHQAAESFELSGLLYHFDNLGMS